MKRDLAAAHAPKVDQNLYYGMYYRFLDYSKRALSRICGGFSSHHISTISSIMCPDVPFDLLSIQTNFCHDVEHLNCFTLIV